MSVASVVPGVRIAAPRDGAQLGRLFREALLVDDGPTLVRFPKGNLPVEIPAWANLRDGVDIVYYADKVTGESSPDTRSVLVIAVGAMVAAAVSAAKTYSNVTVVDPGWVVPVAESLFSLAADHDVVVTVEDGIVRGGIGSLIAEEFAAAGIDVPVRHLGFPSVFPLHASRNELLHEVGLDEIGIANVLAELSLEENQQK